MKLELTPEQINEVIQEYNSKTITMTQDEYSQLLKPYFSLESLLDSNCRANRKRLLNELPVLRYKIDKIREKYGNF